MSFIYAMQDTWNAIGTTFNSIYMNISNGAGGAPVGAAASRAIRIDSNGTVVIDMTIAGLLGLTGASAAILVQQPSGQVGVNYPAAGGFTAHASGSYAFGSSGINSPDLYLFRDAANVLAQRNGTTAQEFRVYSTFTDATNNEYFRVMWSSSRLVLGTFANAPGSQRAVDFHGSSIGFYPIGNASSSGGGTRAWEFNSSGDLVGGADNTYNIGASLTTRPARLYVGSFTKTAVMTLASLSASIATAVSAGNGARSYITDAVALVLGATAAGGGALSGPVYSDGTQWKTG